MSRALVRRSRSRFPRARTSAQPPKVLQRARRHAQRARGRRAEDVALRYVRANLAGSGSTPPTSTTLQPPTITTAGAITDGPLAPGGRRHPRRRQRAAGQPRPRRPRAQRARRAGARPARGHHAGARPRARRCARVQDATRQSTAPLPRRSRRATRAATYADGTTAELALDGRRLVWRVTYEAGLDAVYDAFVDARTGLRPAQGQPGQDRHAGARSGRTTRARRRAAPRRCVDLETNGWLAAGRLRPERPERARVLRRRRQRRRGATEEVARAVRARRQHGLHPGRRRLHGGQAVHLGPQRRPNSWTTNRAPERGPGLLLRQPLPRPPGAAPIGFGSASGSFDQGVDPAPLQTDDGASAGRTAATSTTRTCSRRRTAARRVMQMYLFRPDGYRDDERRRRRARSSTTSTRTGSRTGSSPTPAARGALNSPQAGAMGEGWSDWYAKDFLVGQFPALDTRRPARSTWAPTPTRRRTRSAPGARLPGRRRGRGAARPPAARARAATPTATSARIAGEPEVHADGEIWAADAVGPARARSARPRARRLITDGDAAVAARAVVPGHAQRDPARRPGRRRREPDAIWAVFAARGMGYYASTNVADAAAGLLAAAGAGRPARDDHGRRRPTRATGRAIAGATAAIGALADGPDRLAAHERRRRRATAIGGVPARTYSNLVVTAPGYDRAVARGDRPDGLGGRASTSALRPQLGGARRAARGRSPGPGSDEYADQGCGPDAAIDQLQATGLVDGGLAGRQVDGRRAAAGRRHDRASRSTRARPAATTPTSATRDFRDRDLDRRRPTGRGRSPSTAPSRSAHRHALNPVRGHGAPACARPPRRCSRNQRRRRASSTSPSSVVHGRAGQPAASRRRPDPPTPPPPPAASGRAARRRASRCRPRASATVRFKVRCAVACRVTGRG